MNPLLIGGIVETVGKVADDLFTSDEERARLALEGYQAETSRMAGQVETNKIEAAHASIWVAGWRPAVGWVGVLSMLYQFVVYPMLTWGWSALQAAGWVSADLAPPPMIDTEALWVILTGILGLGAYRSAEKLKGKTN
ncbi:3TM-type holin [Azonexus caeni]|jgi:hypothetical protein|uniref:3TM-type holin n=1 Tax=Azonexus caeni TaxID=266126 RepID=UPI003A86F9E5